MDPVRKPRVATAWLGGCSGCHMSFLDLDERLISLAAAADIVYSPVADVKEFPKGVDVTLVEGAVANEDHLRELKKIRQRTRKLVAFGDCAVNGNVTAMRNLFQLEDVLDRAYKECSAVVTGVPLGNGIVPRLLDRVKRIQDVVEVDYFLPGCPPSADAICSLVFDLVSGREPSPATAAARRFGS